MAHRPQPRLLPFHTGLVTRGQAIAMLQRRGHHAQHRHGRAPVARPVPDAGGAGPRHCGRRLRHGDRGAEHRVGLHPAGGRRLHRPLRPALDRAGRRADLHRRPGHHRHRDSAAMITLGAGVLIGIALSCTTSGIAANIAARVVAPARRSLAFGIVSAAGSMGTFFCAPLGPARDLARRLAGRAGGVHRRRPADAAGGVHRRPRRPAAQLDRARRRHDAARRAQRGAPARRLRGDEPGVLRVRAAARVPHHAPAELPGAVRHGPAARRAGAGRDRAVQRDRLVGLRLARRPLSQAHAAGAAST